MHLAVHLQSAFQLHTLAVLQCQCGHCGASLCIFRSVHMPAFVNVGLETDFQLARPRLFLLNGEAYRFLNLGTEIQSQKRKKHYK